jgi:hypothetical protein
MVYEKNFTYGDLWNSQGGSGKLDSGRKVVDPETITSTPIFIKFLKAHGYKVIVDFDSEHIAYTDFSRKQIVLNGNHPPVTLEALLKHEMGHLMLFGVEQFTTTTPNNFRSVIAKVIYSPENVREYGFEQLMFTENVIQDIIIETLSGTGCVCSTMFSHEGMNFGVKHLDSLENAGHIAKEVCKNILVPKGNFAPPSMDQELLRNNLESILNGLQADSKDILKSSDDLVNNAVRDAQRRSNNAWAKLRDQIKKLKEVEDIYDGELPENLAGLRDTMEAELEDFNESAERDIEAAKERAEKRKKSLDKKLEENEELADLVKQELEGLGDPSAAEDALDGSTSAKPNDSQVDREITPNLTDHLADSTTDCGSTHTFDCGLPIPAPLTRDEARFNSSVLSTIRGTRKNSKVVIHDDSANDHARGKNRTMDVESTYFKPSKREFDNTDMLAGRRRVKRSGINVLIGLDISGSMTHEWGAAFTETSELVESLREKMDIVEVTFFTYNQKLVDYSDDITKLSLKSGGGNAFGYVYQELMSTVPILERNEIILITDCGDNLGFKLNDVCEVERNGVTVENHISIVDTEGSGFYDLKDFDQKSWSIYPKGMKGLDEKIAENIENLIER